MIKPTLTIVTACSRPSNLPMVRDSLPQLNPFFDWRWIVVLDEAKAWPEDVLVKPDVLDSAPTDGEGFTQKNRGIELAGDNTWLYFLDDDNVIHPNFGPTAARAIDEHRGNPDVRVFVFKQQMADGSHRLAAGPVQQGRIDAASFLVHASVIGHARFGRLPNTRADDFVFVGHLFRHASKAFRFIDEYASYHNGLQAGWQNPGASVNTIANKASNLEPTGIYVYWEGPQRHWYYDLCLKTIVKHNPGVKLLARADIEAVLGPIPPELDRIYITHRVDWIRKMFIAAVGGMWLDLDFICFRSLDRLAQLAACDFDFVGFKEWGGNWIDNFFVASRGSRLLRAAGDYALTQARVHGKDLPWLAMASDALGHAFHHHRWCNWMEIPTHLVAPHAVTDAHWFTKQPDTQDDIGPFRSFGFMTSFHTLRGWLLSQSEEDFLKGNSRLLAIFRRALA